jgi:hypothetical protein
MLPSSALRIVESTQSRLVVSDPPSYVVGVILCLIGIAVATFLLRSRGQANIRLLLVVLVPIFLGGLGALTSNSQLEFSHQTETLMIRRSKFGFFHSEVVMPLDSVRYATVQTPRGANRLVVVLNSGEVLSTGSATVRGGYYEAANAINDFLGRHPPR